MDAVRRFLLMLICALVDVAGAATTIQWTGRPDDQAAGFNLEVAARGDLSGSSEYLTVTIISASGVQTLVTSDCGSGSGFTDCGSSYVTCVAETDTFSAQIYEAVLASGGSVTFRFDASNEVNQCSPYFAEARVTLTLSDGSLLTQDGNMVTSGGMFDVTFTDIQTGPTPLPTALPTPSVCRKGYCQSVCRNGPSAHRRQAF